MTGSLAREPVTRRRAVGWGLVALGLVAIVAMEANGAAWSKDRGAQVHSLPHAVMIAGTVGAGVAGVVIFVLVLAGARAVETPEQRRRRWTNAITFLVVIVLISIVALLVHPSHPAIGRGQSSPATIAPATGGSSSGTHTSPTWWPLVIVGIGTAAAFVTAIAARRRPIAGAETDPDAATIALLDASLDDLRRERDPRLAVVAAYARMEHGLAARGFARQPWETPTEYLRRVEPLAAGPLDELTDLAERARFSAFEVDEPMRSRAITALETLRRELRDGCRADIERTG